MSKAKDVQNQLESILKKKRNLEENWGSSQSTTSNDDDKEQQTSPSQLNDDDTTHDEQDQPQIEETEEQNKPESNDLGIEKDDLHYIIEKLKGIDHVLEDLYEISHQFIKETNLETSAKYVKEILRLYDVFDENRGILECRTKTEVTEQNSVKRKPILNETKKTRFLDNDRVARTVKKLHQHLE